MSSRERFNRFVHGESVDHIPDFEFWFWDATLDRWTDEGLPDELTRKGCPDEGELRSRLAKHFGFDYISGVAVKPRFVRWPAEEVIAEDDRTQTVRTEIGEEFIRFKPGCGESIPTHIAYPIKTREDWERIRDEFLPIDIEQRLPANWDQLRAKYADHDTVLNSPLMSFYGFLRNLLGVEEFSVAFALDPDWVEEMMDHMLEIYMAIAQRLVADGVPIDTTGWGEDMCYRNGPLISPEMFERFMARRYRKVTDFYRTHGVDRAIMDSDGNLHKLAPLWLATGINILLPCEVAATDVPALQRENPDLYLRGGIDKRQLARGRDAIDAELERIKPALDTGNYMPHVDHLVPPDVSLADYLYYRDRKRELLGK